MMILFLIIDIINGTFHRILLIDRPPVDMKCQNGNISKEIIIIIANNMLIGPQYFYD